MIIKGRPLLSPRLAFPEKCQNCVFVHQGQEYDYYFCSDHRGNKMPKIYRVQPRGYFNNADLNSSLSGSEYWWGEYRQARDIIQRYYL